MLKKLLPALLIAVSTPLLAQDIVGYTTARVVSIDPITTTAYNTVPRTSCTVVEQRDGTSAEPAAGSIVPNNATRTQERCTTYHDREAFVKVVAFNVTFEYNGQLRTTRMNRDPGNYVNIKTVTRILAYD
jgi:uncharacterized protein YcfJ